MSSVLKKSDKLNLSLSLSLVPDELVNTITEQGFHFSSPNFQDGFDIALTRMVLKMSHIGQHLHAR